MSWAVASLKRVFSLLAGPVPLFVKRASIEPEPSKTKMTRSVLGRSPKKEARVRFI